MSEAGVNDAGVNDAAVNDAAQGGGERGEAVPAKTSSNGPRSDVETREAADAAGPSRLSRRSFLRGTAAAGLTPLLAGAAARAAAQDPAGADAEEATRTVHGVPVYGPGATEVTLSVNGDTRTVTVEPRVTLLDALRDQLDLTGAKRVCDRGTCGACTVLMDDRPVYACSILAIAAQGAELETVENLGTPAEMHPLQAAFVDNDAQQCGFCTPGFVVAGKALLDSNPSPSPDEVVRGLSGNFCRCGTYDGLKRALAVAGGTAPGGDRG